jgi:GT2 family glycosyltransferase
MRNLTVSLLNINQSDLTIDLLDKLTCLSDEDWAVQIILVDNGSDPDQLQTLADWFNAHKDRFAEMLFINASDNLGVSGGRNITLKLADSDKILTLDNDLILPDDSQWLNTLWQHLEDKPEVGIVGPMLVFADYPDIVQTAGIALTDDGRVGYLHRADTVDMVSPAVTEVTGVLPACWLMRREAQQTIGLFSNEYYPMQYEDVDFCLRLTQANWKILCDRRITIKHIGNVTTRNLKDHSYARVAVKHWVKFREKWAAVLPEIATIDQQDIYWGPIPRSSVRPS